MSNSVDVDPNAKRCGGMRAAQWRALIGKTIRLESYPDDRGYFRTVKGVLKKVSSKNLLIEGFSGSDWHWATKWQWCIVEEDTPDETTPEAPKTLELPTEA